MQLDVEDVLAGSVGRIITTAFFFVSSIWVGSWIGGLAWMAGYGDFSDISSFSEIVYPALSSPLFLINLWIIPNAAFLAIMLIHVLVNDGIGHVAWGVIVGMESLFLMLGWCLNSDDPKEPLIAWSCWMVTLVMNAVGLWLHCQMRRNRWVRAMAELSAENAMLRAQRAAMSAAEPTKDPDLK